jgi:hypothetical protein
MGNSKKAGYRASGSNNPIRPHGRKYSSSICSQTAKEVREAPLHGPALCSQGYEASSYRRQLLHSSGGSKKGRRNRRMPLFFSEIRESGSCECDRNKRDDASRSPRYFSWPLRRVEDVRTRIEEQKGYIYIPDLRPEAVKV